MPIDLYHPFSEIFYKLSCSVLYYLRFISTANAGRVSQVCSANIAIEAPCENIKNKFKETLKDIVDCF